MSFDPISTRLQVCYWSCLFADGQWY